MVLIVIIPPSRLLRAACPSQQDGIPINRVTSHILRVITLPCLRLPHQVPALDRRVFSLPNHPSPEAKPFAIVAHFRER